MVITVRGLGTLTLLNGKPMATVELPELLAADVRVGQSAQVDTHKGLVRGHVMRVSLQVVTGMRNVYIALDSALPAGLDANAQVEGTISIAKLENVVYVGRPAGPETSNSQMPLFKVIDNGKAAVRVNVHFGRISVSTIQVLSGLNVGDTVILSDMSPHDKFDRIQIK
jgi:HlyD family secretion protein